MARFLAKLFLFFFVLFNYWESESLLKMQNINRVFQSLTSVLNAIKLCYPSYFIAKVILRSYKKIHHPPKKLSTPCKCEILYWWFITILQTVPSKIYQQAHLSRFKAKVKTLTLIIFRLRKLGFIQHSFPTKIMLTDSV